jgi:hypothetical protein
LLAGNCRPRFETLNRFVAGKLLRRCSQQGRRLWQVHAATGEIQGPILVDQLIAEVNVQPGQRGLDGSVAIQAIGPHQDKQIRLARLIGSRQMRLNAPVQFPPHG